MVRGSITSDVALEGPWCCTVRTVLLGAWCDWPSRSTWRCWWLHSGLLVLQDKQQKHFPSPSWVLAASVSFPAAAIQWLFSLERRDCRVLMMAQPAAWLCQVAHSAADLGRSFGISLQSLRSLLLWCELTGWRVEQSKHLFAMFSAGEYHYLSPFLRAAMHRIIGCVSRTWWRC